MFSFQDEDWNDKMRIWMENTKNKTGDRIRRLWVAFFLVT